MVLNLGSLKPTRSKEEFFGVREPANELVSFFLKKPGPTYCFIFNVVSTGVFIPVSGSTAVFIPVSGSTAVFIPVRESTAFLIPVIPIHSCSQASKGVISCSQVGKGVTAVLRHERGPGPKVRNQCSRQLKARRCCSFVTDRKLTTMSSLKISGCSICRNRDILLKLSFFLIPEAILKKKD